jgi:RNA polymerase-associated protein CTR9
VYILLLTFYFEQARIQYARKQYREALKGFQECLVLNPNMLPDPRIGIGLCFWQLDHRDRALAAWKRAEQVHPSSWYPVLLIGLYQINLSKDPKLPAQKRQTALVEGANRLKRAWTESGLNNASAATAMSDVFLLKGQLNKVGSPNYLLRWKLTSCRH